MEKKYCCTVGQTVQKAYLGNVCKQKAQTYCNRHENGTIKTERIVRYRHFKYQLKSHHNVLLCVYVYFLFFFGLFGILFFYFYFVGMLDTVCRLQS